jgi:hypothetical protein
MRGNRKRFIGAPKWRSRFNARSKMLFGILTEDRRRADVKTSSVGHKCSSAEMGCFGTVMFQAEGTRIITLALIRICEDATSECIKKENLRKPHLSAGCPLSLISGHSGSQPESRKAFRLGSRYPAELTIGPAPC